MYPSAVLQLQLATRQSDPGRLFLTNLDKQVYEDILDPYSPNCRFSAELAYGLLSWKFVDASDGPHMDLRASA